MRVNSKKILKIIDEIAPSHLAETWDNIGYQIGNMNKAIDKVMVTLEITDAVVKEAIEENVDLIITHHPLIFKKMKNIDYNDPIGKISIDLIKNDISVIAAHTNLDIAKDGINDYFAKLFNLQDVTYLKKEHESFGYKLAVYVPKENHSVVFDAMMEAGAGQMGNYSHASYNIEGTGTFMPNNDANPAIGEANILEKVDEIKIEVMVEKTKLHHVITQMLNAHPYEEVAYDVFKMEKIIDEAGTGRVGYLSHSMKFNELLDLTKSLVKVDHLKYSGDLNKTIRRIGLCNGAGDDFIGDAIRNKCDVYITGDVKYHMARYAEQNRLMIIDAGHFETEILYIDYFKDKLKSISDAKGYDLQWVVSHKLENSIKTY